MTPTERLQQLACQPEEALDLAEAALVIAEEEYPQLDIGAYLRRLDDLAQTVRGRLAPDVSPEHTIATLNHFLYREQGFTGNAAEYYDPRNSFLNEVLDRKLGIPITLAVIYIEIARRLGLSLQGVSFPGHFLMKLALGRGTVILDPYMGGISLSEKDLRARLMAVCGEQASSLPLNQALASADKKEILARILRNLKAIYLQTDALPKALAAADRILVITPDAPHEVRDRGLLYARLECPQAALTDLQRYLRLEPRAVDAEEIAVRIDQLKKQGVTLH
jgi:regulator of sirC expression with transglutaminase-like and TPR domain